MVRRNLNRGKRNDAYNTATRRNVWPEYERLEPRCLLAAGDLDATFGNGGKVTTDLGAVDVINSVAVQLDQRLVAAGTKGLSVALARYTPDGALDTTFGAGGIVTHDFGAGLYGGAEMVRIQTDGKIVVAGYTGIAGSTQGDWFLARYDTGGDLDSSFGNGGFVIRQFGMTYEGAHDLVIQPDGKLVALGFAGTSHGVYDVVMIRCNPDGSLDDGSVADSTPGDSFGIDGVIRTDIDDSDSAFGLALAQDGDLIAVGTTGSNSQADASFVVRYNSDGSLDTGFGSGGIVTTNLSGREFGSSVAVLENGQIVVGGSTTINGPQEFAVLRYQPDGQLDTGFGVNGVATAGLSAQYYGAESLAIQSDGRILAAGFAINGDGQDKMALARFEVDGSPDTSFGSGGTVITLFGGSFAQTHEVRLQADGRIVIAGYAETTPGNIDFALARFDGGFQPMTISGVVYDDSNNDGGFQAGSETGLLGIVITLTGTDALGSLVNRTTSSLANGSFEFGGVLPGIYNLDSAQPLGFLDGKELAGSGGGTVDNSTNSKTIAGIFVGPESLPATNYGFGNVLSAELSGLIWEDFNADGEVNFGERTIGDVAVALTGVDDRGQAVSLQGLTESDGAYMFFDLRPGTYSLAQVQPAGFNDGPEILGTINGLTVGSITGNDRIGNIGLEPGAAAINYNFAERPLNGGGVSAGQTATIGFWQNKKGRALIVALNGGGGSTQLSGWLATTLPNMYGATAGANDLSGMTNLDVWEFYNSLFRRKQKEAMALGLSGPVKTDAQVFATALAVYVTNQTLAGNTASCYGFTVSQYGTGASMFNVGSAGQAFGVANGSSVSVLNLLLAVNSQSRNGLLYDLDGNGNTNNPLEKNLRTLANAVFAGINEEGDC